jgi:hypothetical protein
VSGVGANILPIQPSPDKSRLVQPNQAVFEKKIIFSKSQLSKNKPQIIACVFPLPIHYYAAPKV